MSSSSHEVSLGWPNNEVEATAQQTAAYAYLGSLWHSDIDDATARAEVAGIIRILFGSLTNSVGRGKVSAISLLLDIVRSGVTILNDNALRHPRTYERLARRLTLWPVLITPHRDSCDAAQAFVQRLRLGTKTGVSYKNRKAFRWKDEKAIAADLYLELLTRRNFPERRAVRPDEPWDRLVSKLPVLSRNKAVLAAWWKAIFLLFEDRYGPAFETNRAFARHWMAPTFRPKGKRGDGQAPAKQLMASLIYCDLVEWCLYASCGRRKARHIRLGHDPSLGWEDQTPIKKGSWQHAAVRLPLLGRRNAVIDQWFEVARLLSRDPESEYFQYFSPTDFACYMKNALSNRSKIRKHIKDLLEQALRSIARETSESEARDK